MGMGYTILYYRYPQSLEVIDDVDFEVCAWRLSDKLGGTAILSTGSSSFTLSNTPMSDATMLGLPWGRVKAKTNDL